MLKDLIEKNRSYRRFDASHEISREILLELVGLARLSATGGNLQSLRFFPACEPGVNEKIFPSLRWAGALTDWDGPIEAERPTAYIVILNDIRIVKNPGCNHGIAAQSILLGAVEKGLGGCMIGAFVKKDLIAALGIPEYLDPLLVIALGRPVEKVVIDVATGDDTKYWREKNGIHHVPKRPLDELIVEF